MKVAVVQPLPGIGDTIWHLPHIRAIAAHVGLDAPAFTERFTRLNANRTGLSLIDKPNGECIFLEGVNVCAIQSVKPHQCSGFPNQWRFPGWREKCEAVEVSRP